MRTNPGPRRNRTAKALLNIYEAKDILREDQELFHKTLFNLKKKLSSLSKRKAHDSISSNGQRISDS